uniref:Uncharacterized protein n=1 Tax=Opuntia streptacantha TaxID=393608 RepID=A0A7C9EB41_OPUST
MQVDTTLNIASHDQLITNQTHINHHCMHLSSKLHITPLPYTTTSSIITYQNKFHLTYRILHSMILNDALNTIQHVSFLRHSSRLIRPILASPEAVDLFKHPDSIQWIHNAHQGLSDK